jgi:ABC-type lipoprotein export system ATPase subunit
LIVADEPTSELDHDSRERVIGVLHEATQSGSIVVLSTHDDAVAETCDQIIRLGSIAHSEPARLDNSDRPEEPDPSDDSAYRRSP